MESTSTRNEDKKGSRMSQAATPLDGGPVNMGKVSLSRSEEFLTRISTELTNEALFIAGCHMNSVPIKEKQTQDQGTQISKHVFFKTRGTDTRSDRNRTCTKTHLLPSSRDKLLPLPPLFSHTSLLSLLGAWQPCSPPLDGDANGKTRELCLAPWHPEDDSNPL
ncbi:putative protein T-ENOL isoform X3 [Canis aureus]